MAAKRSKAQLEETGQFVRWLFEKSGAGTWKEFADNAGVHWAQVSDFQRGVSCPDGYNLLRLIRAAGVLDEPLLTDGPSDRAEAMRQAALIERIRKLLDQGEPPRSAPEDL